MKFKLVCFDLDGVLLENINFWMEVHKAFGTLEEGKVLTEKYLHADYDKLVEEVVVKLWKGRDADPYFKVVNMQRYNPGVKETIKQIRAKGYETAIISASSLHVVKRVQEECSITYGFANELVIEDNKVAGRFNWPIGAGYEGKVKALEELCNQAGCSSKEIIYIGDTKKDVQISQAVGKSIAFNCQDQELKDIATHVVESNDLRGILPYIE